MASGGVIAGAVVVVIILVIALAYIVTNSNSLGSGSPTSMPRTSASGTTAQGASYQTVPVGMTDPPSVPPGTSAVVIAYSKVQVQQKASNGTTSWVNASGSGSVNAMAVVNSSQTIADARLAINSTVNAVRVNVTSVKVTVNGTTYTATSPGWITANVTSNGNVKANSALLVDFVTNVKARGNSSTSSNTVAGSSGAAYAYMDTSAKAWVTTNASVSVNIGAMIALNSTLKGIIGVSIG